MEKRLADLSVSPFDIVRLPNDAVRVGIADIRDMIHDLSISPNQSKTKAGVLTALERLTPEAQNALLKTLEEPPPHTVILAETGQADALLPTILSRFTVVPLGPEDSSGQTDYQELIKTLLASSPGHVLTLLEPYTKTSDEAKVFVAALIVSARALLLSAPAPGKLTKLIRNLLTAQSMLSVNVNQKLVVDNAFLL